MDGRGKDSQDDIEQVEHHSHCDPDDNVSGAARDIVCGKSEKDRAETDGHDPDVGDNIADALKEFERRKQPPGKEQKGHQEKDHYYDRLRHDFREDIEERCKYYDQADDDQDAEELK